MVLEVLDLLVLKYSLFRFFAIFGISRALKFNFKEGVSGWPRLYVIDKAVQKLKLDV